MHCYGFNMNWAPLCNAIIIKSEGKVQPNIPEDSEELVDLWVPMEKRLFSCQLSKYGTYAPYIDRSRVTSRS